MSANGTKQQATPTIREQRRSAGLTQERLSALVGCSLSYVRLLEAGYRPGSSAVLDRVAAVLNDERRRVITPAARETSGVRSAGHVENIA
jgi:transcriptional regulator with XRE-family HTH domain